MSLCCIVFSHADWSLVCLTMSREGQSYVVTGGVDERLCVWSATAGRVCNNAVIYHFIALTTFL